MSHTVHIKWKPLLVSILLALGAGWLSARITGDTMGVYSTLHLPPLSPPGIVFPFVWAVLYLLMGISAYLIATSDSPNKKAALTVYAISLLVNVLWTPIFFRANNYLAAFVWLVLLWVLVLATIILFHRINKTAAFLLLPYLLWITFAGYLNLGVYLLN